MPLKSNYWQTTKYDLHFYTAGDPEKLPIIFFHGFLGSGLDWKEIIEKLSQNFYCLALDLPGHGKTRVHGPISDYSMESFAVSITKFVKNKELHNAILLGYSMGGRIALFLSAMVKNLWSAAILESATPGLRQEKQRIERRTKDTKIANKLEKEKLEDFLNDWYQQPLFATIGQVKNFNSILKQRQNNDPFELAKALRMMGVGVQPSLWNACKMVNIPILLLAGEFDRKFCNILRDMNTVNTEFGVKIVKNAGHNVHLEQPDAYYKEIYKFLISIEEKRS
jgi:2-succinyl-6-hydroxy-2,4-cyclohexadiene-1-carboxylate synthase